MTMTPERVSVKKKNSQIDRILNALRWRPLWTSGQQKKNLEGPYYQHFLLNCSVRSKKYFKTFPLLFMFNQQATIL